MQGIARFCLLPLTYPKLKQGFQICPFKCQWMLLNGCGELHFQFWQMETQKELLNTVL